MIDICTIYGIMYLIKVMYMAIYSRENFEVHATGSGYVIHNTDYHFKEAHSHLKSFKQCKVIINNLIYKKKLHTKNTYLLRSYLRLSKDSKYQRKIKHLIEKAKDKQKYVNVGGRRV
jgi:hypothetical protein